MTAQFSKHGNIPGPGGAEGTESSPLRVGWESVGIKNVQEIAPRLGS